MSSVANAIKDVTDQRDRALKMAIALEQQYLKMREQRDELLEALKHHQEQTRPIQRSVDVIAKAKGANND